MTVKVKKSVVMGVAVSVAVFGFLYLRPQSGQKSTQSDFGFLPTANATVPVQMPTNQVRYVSVDDGQFDDKETATIKRQIKNLQNTGSRSGGVMTDEFKQATHAKMSYRFGRKQKLSFEMTKPDLPQGFVLTGRQYDGERITDEGVVFDEIYRLFENPQTKARMEITQAKFDKSMVFVQEFFNETIGGVPICLESLTDAKGVHYYRGEFVAHDTHIKITAKGMTREAFLAVVASLVGVS